jgi:hypothetical protein
MKCLLMPQKFICILTRRFAETDKWPYRHCRTRNEANAQYWRAIFLQQEPRQTKTSVLGQNGLLPLGISALKTISSNGQKSMS